MFAALFLHSIQTHRYGVHLGKRKHYIYRGCAHALLPHSTISLIQIFVYYCSSHSRKWSANCNRQNIVFLFFFQCRYFIYTISTWGSADVLNISIGVIRPQIITGKEMGCCKATQTFPAHELPTPCLHICATFYHLHLSECFHLLCNHWNKEYLTGCFGGMGCVSDDLTAQSDSSVVYGSPQMFSNNFLASFQSRQTGFDLDLCFMLHIIYESKLSP